MLSGDGKVQRDPRRGFWADRSQRAEHVGAPQPVRLEMPSREPRGKADWLRSCVRPWSRVRLAALCGVAPGPWQLSGGGSDLAKQT